MQPPEDAQQQVAPALITSISLSMLIQYARAGTGGDGVARRYRPPPRLLLTARAARCHDARPAFADARGAASIMMRPLDRRFDGDFLRPRASGQNATQIGAMLRPAPRAARPAAIDIIARWPRWRLPLKISAASLPSLRRRRSMRSRSNERPPATKYV